MYIYQYPTYLYLVSEIQENKEYNMGYEIECNIRSGFIPTCMEVRGTSKSLWKVGEPLSPLGYFHGRAHQGSRMFGLYRSCLNPGAKV